MIAIGLHAMTADELRRDRCKPLKGASHRLEGDALQTALKAVPDWSLRDEGAAIGRDFKFKGFLEALSFANALGWLAERENHHPDVELGWGYCRVRFSTHDVGGLSRNDFICAAKVDELVAGR
jgi:4a-hydroxytetrahydrobiopterin dehydratase